MKIYLKREAGTALEIIIKDLGITDIMMRKKGRVIRSEKIQQVIVSFFLLFQVLLKTYNLHNSLY